nr:hypothetical protein [Microseira wollei]
MPCPCNNDRTSFNLPLCLGCVDGTLYQQLHKIGHRSLFDLT